MAEHRDQDGVDRYRRTAAVAVDPPGGVPAGWSFLRVRVYGEFGPEEGQWWNAAAEYVQSDRSCGVRRLIGAGPSVAAALEALNERLAEPLEKRRANAKGGWDTNMQPGYVVHES